jgi:hypothetical protein
MKLDAGKGLRQCAEICSLSPPFERGTAVGGVRVNALFGNDLQVSEDGLTGGVTLAGQVQFHPTRKEAVHDVLDPLHPLFSTLRTMPLSQRGRHPAVFLLSLLPFASFESWPQQWGRFFASNNKRSILPAYNRVEMRHLTSFLGIAVMAWLSAPAVWSQDQPALSERAAVLRTAAVEFGQPLAPDTFAVSPDFKLRLFFGEERLVRAEVSLIKETGEYEQPLLSPTEYQSLRAKIEGLKPLGNPTATGSLIVCGASSYATCGKAFEHGIVGWSQNRCDPWPCPVRNFAIDFEQWRSGRIQSKHHDRPSKLGSVEFRPDRWSVTVGCDSFFISEKEFRSLKVGREVCLRYTENGNGSAQATIADPSACQAKNAAKVTASEAAPSPHPQ